MLCGVLGMVDLSPFGWIVGSLGLAFLPPNSLVPLIDFDKVLPVSFFVGENGSWAENVLQQVLPPTVYVSLLGCHGLEGL